jgi:hypothetical protein
MQDGSAAALNAGPKKHFAVRNSQLAALFHDVATLIEAMA